MITRKALRAVWACALLAISLMNPCASYAEEGSMANNGGISGTEYSTGKIYQGKAAEYRERDVLSILELLPGTSWDKEERAHYTRFSNHNSDTVFVEKGRIYYIRGNDSRNVDYLFSQLRSDLDCMNNNDIFEDSKYDLACDREKGITADEIEDERIQQNCRDALGILQRVVPDQQPYLIRFFEKTSKGEDYVFMVFGFQTDGIPVYGYNEAALGIINPDETETAVRETAYMIFNREGLCCLEVTNIMTTEYMEEKAIISGKQAAEILNEWISLLPGNHYILHQCWLSEVPLGDFSREPLIFTPCWAFSLTWEEYGETWVAMPRINALTGELLWW